LPSSNFFTVPSPSIVARCPSHSGLRCLVTIIMSGDLNLL
jgi:hypothetical protein